MTPDVTPADFDPAECTPPDFDPAEFTSPDFAPADFAAAMEATWPPAATHRAGPWLIREGQGGGKRVSAASAEGEWSDPDIARAEAGLLALGQQLLFVIWSWDQRLDDALAIKGYARIDPVLGYAAPVTAFEAPARMSAFPHWPPMQIARDIWAEAEIGPGRLAVMQRATGLKTAVLGRTADHPSGVAFVAIHGKTALIHALEVRPPLRRQGAARNILNAAAQWAANHGAVRLALAVTEANHPARALYTSLGMQPVGHYHYRIK